MHFSIPDTQEFIDNSGNSFLSYNIHINGLFHCTVRYKQLLNLHEQLIKEIDIPLAQFPPKKLFPLTANQQEERRFCLEKYIQAIGQNAVINNSELVNGFLLNAQQESAGRICDIEIFDLYLMRGQRIPLEISTADNSRQVLKKLCRAINLPEEFDIYFSLYLIIQSENQSANILRRLEPFESPILTQENIGFPEVKVVMGKGYWDIKNDGKLIYNSVALNLLYIQAISEIERGWIPVPVNFVDRLRHAKDEGNQIEYLEIVKTLKYYGYIQFAPCTCDYPQPNSKVLVAIGRNELNLRILLENNEEHEAIFKVTRMKCWRITTLHDGMEKNDNPSEYSLELSFEYLVAKNQLQWVTISSDQAILMSVCLQGMIDELLVTKNNISRYNPSGKLWTYVMRDGHTRITINFSGEEDKAQNKSSEMKKNTASRKKAEKSMGTKSKEFNTPVKADRVRISNCDIMENNAFHMIGDDDL